MHHLTSLVQSALSEFHHAFRSNVLFLSLPQDGATALSMALIQAEECCGKASGVSSGQEITGNSFGD